MTTRRGVVLVLVGGAMALIVAHEAARMYADYEWYRTMGALAVWKARLASLAALRLLGWLAIGLFAFANFYAVRNSVVSLVLPRRIANVDFGEEVPSKALNGIALALAIVVAAALAMSLHDWTGFLLAHIGQPFGETDPFFDADLGFFTYRLPYEHMLLAWTTVSALVVTAAVVFLYLLTPGLRLEGRHLHASEYIQRHLLVLGGVFVLLLAWHFRLTMYGVLLHGSAPDSAVGLVDHRVRIPGELVLSIVTLAAGLVVIWGGWTGQRRLVVSAILALALTAFVTRGAAPWIARHAMAGVGTARSESPYDATRAGYTRRAYAVDHLVSGDSTVVFRSLADAAIGVPIWDAAALTRALAAESRLTERARVTWRADTDGIVAVASSPEPPPAPGQAAPAGISIGTLASAADRRGAPVRIPQSDADDEAVVLAPAVVLDSDPGDLVVSDSGAQVRGLALSSPLERIAAGLSVRNLRLWGQELPGPHPVLVTERNARTRVRALVPFFAQGSEVNALVEGDSLYWVIELYAASDTYPLSQSYVLGGAARTYFHHAATALVLATTGAVQFVLDSARGPIADTWAERFPALFATGRDVPPAVLAQLPPPLDATRAMALAFGEFGTRSNSGVPAQPPLLDGGDSTLAGVYPLIALPSRGPTALVMPLLDAVGRVQGLLISEGGARQRIVWHVVRDTLPPRWTYVLDQLAAADTAAGHTVGDTVVYGVVRAFPLEGTAGYLQPVYRWKPGATPTLLGVAWFVNGKAHFAPTLRRAEGRPALAANSTGAADVDTRARLRQLYDTMREALRRGDWVAFGKAFDALGALLDHTPP